MTTNTYGGYTVAQLRQFITDHYDPEHGGNTIDEYVGDDSASVNIVRDLLDAIEPQQDGDLLRPVARWVYNAVRVNLDLLHGICMERGSQPGDDVALWLRDLLTNEKSLAPVQASEAADQRPGTEIDPTEVHPTAEVIVGRRAAGSNETSSKVSCADALTDAQILEIGYKHFKPGHNIEAEANFVAAVRDVLAAYPVEQHGIADMANIGYALMQRIAQMAPGYSWCECPTEIVSDLINERDEALAAAKPAPTAPLEGTGNGADAWMTEDGRVISDAQKQQALRDGGASASSVRPYSIELRRRAPRTEVAGAVPDWRELSRRLYVELFHCDQQMRSTCDEDGEPHWTQSTVVRDVLADAKAALEAAPQPPSADAAVRNDHICHDGEDCHACDAERAAAAPADGHYEALEREHFGDPDKRTGIYAPEDERAAFPRYTEWLHLRTHGEWSNGVPDWARDHTGRMNDFTAASAVIEELAARAAASQPAAASGQEAQPFGWTHPRGGNYFTRNKSSADRVRGLIPVYTAPPAQLVTRQGPMDEQWYDLASRHANAEWNGDGYLASVKALCDDYRALLAAQQPEPIAHLTDDRRDKIERAEERLRGRGPEDVEAANGLLDVLTARPVQPEPRAEVAADDQQDAMRWRALVMNGEPSVYVERTERRVIQQAQSVAFSDPDLTGRIATTTSSEMWVKRYVMFAWWAREHEKRTFTEAVDEIRAGAGQ